LSLKIYIFKVISLFPRWINCDENERMLRLVSKEDLLHVITTFKKHGRLGPNGWTIGFCLYLFNLLAEDLVRVVQEVSMPMKVPRNIDATFISLIPKVNYPETFEGFLPISLYKFLYKIISKVLVVTTKPLISKLSLERSLYFFREEKFMNP
jgi:hypothetical protein